MLVHRYFLLKKQPKTPLSNFLGVFLFIQRFLELKIRHRQHLFVSLLWACFSVSSDACPKILMDRLKIKLLARGETLALSFAMNHANDAINLTGLLQIWKIKQFRLITGGTVIWFQCNSRVELRIRALPNYIWD